MDLTGKRFGLLTVLRRDPKWSRKARWICRCDCGQEAAEYSRSFQRKDNYAPKACKDCKKKLRKHRVSLESRLLKRLYSNYKAAAKHREIPFYLNKNEAIDIFCSPCYYCGTVGGRKYEAKGIGTIRTNGIDRIDSSLGYNIENVVPCCPICNFMKSSLTVEKFLSHIKLILDTHHDNVRIRTQTE